MQFSQTEEKRNYQKSNKRL